MNQNNTFLKENKRVQMFIKNWQVNNDILNFESIEFFNSKFKKDFNHFLNSNDFSEETKNIFLIQ